MVLTGPAVASDGRIIITAKKIARMKVIKIVDVLNQMPGLKASDTSISIHGSYKVKVLVDGRPVNDPTSSIGGVRWDMISLENVEKIEILKGKGSLEYGDDASGGVILVSTKKTGSLSGNIKGYAGNRGTWKMSAGGRAGRGPMGVFASGAVYETNGYQVNNDKKQHRAGVKIGYTPSKTTGISLSVDHLDEKKGIAGRPDYPTPYSRQESYMDSFSLAGHLGAFKTAVFFNQGEKHSTDISKDLDNTLLVREAGTDLNHSFEFDQWGVLAAGISMDWGEASGTTLNTREETHGAVFGSYAYSMASMPVTISAGLRANAYSDFTNSLNPDVKISWHNTDIQVTAAYNRANNAPSFYQRYNRTSSTLPNPDLDMEVSDNYSISMTAKIRPDLSVGATVFYNQLRNRITYVRNSGVGQYQNIGEAVYQGCDFSVNWNIHERVSFTAAYTLLEATDETSDLWLTAKARHKGNAQLTLSPFENCTIVAGIDASAKVYTKTDNTQTVPGYILYSLRGEYVFKKITFFGEIKNLTDTTYYYADGNLAPPLTWLMGVNVRL